MSFPICSSQLLIEPSSSQSLCQGVEEVPLLVMVSSAPSHLDSRQAIRQTWAQKLPTFFVLGLDSPEIDEEMVRTTAVMSLFYYW